MNSHDGNYDRRDLRLQKQPGRLTALLMKWLFRQATVRQSKEIAKNFFLIDLYGDDLKGIEWIPGQKIQIDVGGGVSRTYTPISWDPIVGQTSVVAYAHGWGPGSTWCSTIAAGERCQFFGPRHSLDLRYLDVELPIFFGDETSLGLASTLISKGGQTAGTFLFEVSDGEAAACAWHQLVTHPATFVERKPADTHLSEVEERMETILDKWIPESFVLAGKAVSIQRVRKYLRDRGIATSRIRTKAYWSPGKIGLD